MYHLYHTEALVLGGEPQGEGSRRLALFTRELGLLSAVATSVREERSKLRYGLQDFSLSQVTLVRGREIWRVTNAVALEEIFSGANARQETRALLARIFRLLRRLLTGEEKNERLFVAVREAFLLFGDASPSPETLAHIEMVLVLRILFLLGYLAPRGEFDSVLSEPFLWSPQVFREAGAFRALALAEINHSLNASQL